MIQARRKANMITRIIFQLTFSSITNPESFDGSENEIYNPSILPPSPAPSSPGALTTFLS